MVTKNKRISHITIGKTKGSRRALILILAAGLAIKVAYLFFSQASPFYEPRLLDPAYYHEWAQRIAAGNLADPPVFYGLPLYPFFLGFCYKIFGGSLLMAKLVQALLGTVTLYFVYKIGRKLFSQETGLLAALLAAFYGPFFFNEQILIPEAIGIPLYAAAFYLVCLFEEAPTVKRGALLGAFLGLAALTKANALLFVFLYLPLCFFRRRAEVPRRIKSVLVCALTLLAVLAPVTAHNYFYGKDAVLLSSHTGLNFYVGNNPKAQGVFEAPEGTGTNVEAQREGARVVAEKAAGRSLKPSEVSSYWSGRAMEFIRQNPGRFAELFVKKIALFFDAREISDLEDFEFSGTFVDFLKFPWLNFAFLGPLFLLGLAVSLGKARHATALYLWIFAYLAGLAAFFVNARYRLPILSVFFPLAAVGLIFLWRSFKAGEWGRILLSVLVLGIGVWLTRLNLVGADTSVFYVNAGDASAKKGETQKAMEFYREALRIRPDNAKASLAMGLALSKTGRPDDAEKYYRDAINADPSNSESYNNLGLWYDEQGRLEEAEKCFLKAAELKPSSFQPHNNLGMVYGKLGQNQKAKEELETALRLNPQSARAYTNLGLVLYRLGDTEGALKNWKRALEIDPNFEMARRALRLYETTLYETTR